MIFTRGNDMSITINNENELATSDNVLSQLLEEASTSEAIDESIDNNDEGKAMNERNDNMSRDDISKLIRSRVSDVTSGIDESTFEYDFSDIGLTSFTWSGYGKPDYEIDGSPMIDAVNGSYATDEMLVVHAEELRSAIDDAADEIANQQSEPQEWLPMEVEATIIKVLSGVLSEELDESLVVSKGTLGFTSNSGEYAAENILRELQERIALERDLKYRIADEAKRQRDGGES